MKSRGVATLSRGSLATLATLAALAFASACALSCTKGAPPASLLDGAPGEHASPAPSDSVNGDAGALAATLDAGAAPVVDELQARAQKLFEAIQKDEPDVAMSLFFPREPFIAIKDMKDAGAYWDKLAKDYKAHIHSFHKKLGKKAAEAEFDGFELNTKSQVYVAPKKEFNKTGYNKVVKSKLKYKIKGKQHAFELAVMIDNDAKWYVTHLRK